MIARIWHGKTNIENYESFTIFLKEIALPDYQATAGFKGLFFLRTIKDNEGHFTLITHWESIEVIKNFAGDDFEKAKYYPESKKYLIELEEFVDHYEVFAN